MKECADRRARTPMYLLVGKGLILVAIVEVNGSIAKLCTGKFICGFSVLYLESRERYYLGRICTYLHLGIFFSFMHLELEWQPNDYNS